MNYNKIIAKILQKYYKTKNLSIKTLYLDFLVFTEFSPT